MILEISAEEKSAKRGGWIAAPFVLIVAVFSILATASAAQTPDPETLRRLQEQRQQLEGQAERRRSPVDSAREERERSREEEFAGEQEPEPLSAIEQEYNARLGRELKSQVERDVEEDLLEERLRREARGEGRRTSEVDEEEPEVLRQFGYDIFRRSSFTSDGTTLTGRLPPDYVLGIGDEIVVSLVGSTNRVITTEVDREGRVVLPDLPPIPAAGRSFAEFQEALRSAVSETLLGTQAFVSVANVRQISVGVFGEVEDPGLYNLTSLSDALQALARAGGIEKSGSLRRILIINGNERRRLDLYALMAGETDMDMRLEDGDRVVVPVIGETVAVAGKVVRPAIYELAPNTEQVSVSEALNLAGSPLRRRGTMIQRNRIDEVGRQQVQAVKTGTAVEGGDIYEVRPARDLQMGLVRIEGHVRQPGTRPLGAAPTLSALLADGEALSPSPYGLFAVLERTDPQSLQRVFRPVKLGQAMTGEADIELKDKDRLIVLGPEEIDYLSSSAVRGAALSPKNVSSNACSAVRELARRARQADTERLAAAARSVFIAETGGPERRQRQEEQERSEDLAQEAGSEVVTQEELAGEAAEVAECNDLFEKEPRLLPLAIEYSIAAIGAVRQPGLYPIAGESSLDDLVAASGGLTLSANRSRVEITSFRQGAGERRYVDLTNLSLEQVNIPPASAVRFSAQESRLEAGTVLLSGEFRHPGVYTINKGEKLSSVIERAGGLTDQAYPFGAVFTRQRVKQEQQESFRRTARELNNGLALAVMKDNISGEGLEAASGLVRNLTTVEAAGRVVIEADPVELKAHPERDIMLEGGDSLFMPKRPNYVLTAGDVLNPGALQFHPGKDVEDYLAEAGGFQETADDNRVFVVQPNGEAKPVTLSRWVSSDVHIRPGSTIVVPKDVNPLETLNIVREFTNVLSNLAVSAASIAVISDD